MLPIFFPTFSQPKNWRTEAVRQIYEGKSLILRQMNPLALHKKFASVILNKSSVLIPNKSMSLALKKPPV